MSLNSVFNLQAVFSVIDRMTRPLRRMAGGVTSLDNLMRRARGMQEFGIRLGFGAAAVTAAADKMRGAIMSLAGPYMRIEQATAQLQTVTTSTMGSMQASLKASRQAALEWSKNHTDTAESYIRACTSMASAGLNDVQAIAGTSSALALAKANMGDAGAAAELLAQLYNNMGVKTRDANQEMAHLGDIMTKTMQLYQIKDLGALGEGLAEGMASAKNYRVSVEELNMVIGQLNNLGIKGSTAGTAFSAALRQMNKASHDLGFEIARTADGGVNFTQTIENIKNKYGAFADMTRKQQMAFQTAFGDEGLKAVGLLMDQTGGMKKALQEVAGATGETAKALGILEDTGAARLQITMNKLEAMKAQFGEKILGNKKMMEEILPGIINTVEWIGNLTAAFMEAHPAVTQNIVLLIGLGTVVLMIVAPLAAVASGFASMAGVGLGAVVKLAKGVKWLHTSLTSGALLARLAALRIKIVSTFMAGRAAVIRCAAAMQTFIISLWRTSAAAVTTAARGIKRMTLSLAAMARQAAITALAGLRTLAVSLAQAGRAAAIAAAQGLRAMAMALAGLVRQAILTAATALPAMIATVWSFTAALLANPITWIVIALAALGAAIYYCAQHWDVISAAAQNAWTIILDAFQGGLMWIQGALNGAASWIAGMTDTFFASGAALWDAFANGIKSTLSGPVEAVQSGLQQIRNMLPFSDAREGPLSQLTHNGSKLMATLAAGVTAGAPALQKAVRQGLGGEWLQAAQDKLKAVDFQIPAGFGSSVDGIAAGGAAGKANGFGDDFNLSGLFAGGVRRGNPGAAAADPAAKKEFHFYFAAGAITIQADRLDNADSVMSVFKQLAIEVGAE